MNPILRLKDSSVNLIGLVPQMLFAINVIHGVLSEQGKDTVITSANDGKHSLTSLHYAGAAVDFRSHWYCGKSELVDKIKSYLGVDFDFILEGEGTPNAHFHVEYQPRRR